MLALPGPIYDLSQPVRVGDIEIVLDKVSAPDTASCVWDASVICCHYLWSKGVAGKKVLELGCGQGLVSICAAKLGAQAIATDLLSVLPAVLHNAAKNQALVECRSLDWNCPEFIEADLIVCSDLVWVSPLVEPLVRTLGILLTTSNAGLIIYKSRSRFVDERFFKGLADAGLECELLEIQSEHSIYGVRRS